MQPQPLRAPFLALPCFGTVTVALLTASLAGAGILPAQDLRPVGGGDITFHRGCYDRIRQRFVTVDSARRTWEHDGVEWVARPHTAPAVYDLDLVAAPSLGKVFGLAPGDVFTPMLLYAYDGAGWLPVTIAGAPSGRADASFAWDSHRHEVVLFGGSDTWLLSQHQETWTFDGVAWTLHSPAVRPSARTLAAMTYDSGRQRAVLFGGLDWNVGIQQDTWEWDGSTWQQRFPVTVPDARYQAAFTYDPSRGRSVMYGGAGTTPSLPDELWEYDGVNWQLRSPSLPMPTGRVAADLYFDDRHGEVVLAGGFDMSGTLGVPAHDGWRWNGSRWLPHSWLPSKPGPRTAATLVAEANFANAILFGGVSSSAMLDDTWRWDGQQWVELPVSGPPARASAAACTSPTEVWLFGGATGLSTVQYLDDTWRWDGVGWTTVAAPLPPSPRSLAGMAHEIAGSRAILFGGYSGVVHGDTWAFDGSNWQQLNPLHVPPARFGHALASDPMTGRLLMYGGHDANHQPLTDTWQWTGSDWQQLTPATTPPPNGQCTMQFDVLRQAFVMFSATGGYGAAEVWQFDGIDWAPIPLMVDHGSGYGAMAAVAPGFHGVLLCTDGTLYQLAMDQAVAEAYGVACGPGAPQLSAKTWPSLGSAFAFDCSGNDPASLVAFVVAFAAASTPVGGCTLLVAPGQVVTVQPSNAAGFASQPMPLPTWPGLLGLDLYAQAASLRPTAPNGFVLSRGLALTLGM